jgi:hypothetical protein
MAKLPYYINLIAVFFNFYGIMLCFYHFYITFATVSRGDGHLFPPPLTIEHII